jgi:hypothetical protein
MTIERPMFPPRAESVDSFFHQPDIGQPNSQTLTSAPAKAIGGLSRRATLVGLALLPAALPAAEVGPDPVYALIERHKALSAAYTVACEHPDFAEQPIAEPEAEAVVERSLDELVDASEKLLAFQAPTLSGVAAQLRYLSGLEDWQTVGRLTDDPKDVHAFCATTASAIEAIIQRGQA